MDTCVRIKRLVLSQRVIFTAKAEIEMYADGLTRVPCPVCGRKALLDVVEDCRLSGGRRVRRLRHTRCEACGERFFDVAAMKAIERSAVSSRHRRSA